MAYYPQSQIKTNLYTNGDEFFLISTQTPYTGYYYKLSTNKNYTGKNPNEAEGIELIPNTTVAGSPPTPLSNETQDYIITTKDMSDANEDLLYYNNALTLIYPQLESFQKRTLPNSIPKPPPTAKEAQIGEYRRYFTKKTNEWVYMEISKETYNRYISRDPNVASDLYDVLFLPWSIDSKNTIGDEKSPTEINKNIVALTEKDNKWYGFTSYFRGQFG